MSSEFSDRQMIHMKCQVLFSLKTKQKLRMLSAANLFGALRVNFALQCNGHL